MRRGELQIRRAWPWVGVGILAGCASLDGLTGGTLPPPPADVEAGADAAPEAAIDRPLDPCDRSKPFTNPRIVDDFAVDRVYESPNITADELTVYFTTHLIGIGSYDLARATRTSKSSPFTDFGILPQSQPTIDEFDPSVSADNLSLVFTVNDDLYAATRASTITEFGSAIPLAGVNTASPELQPFRDSRTGDVWFVSNRNGSWDIFRAPAIPSGFGPTLPVTELNDPGADDWLPHLDSEGLTMVFSSSRTGTLGLHDLWIATRPTTRAPFGAPTNLEALNSPSRELGASFSPDGCRLYFSSDRDGRSRLYVAEKPALR